MLCNRVASLSLASGGTGPIHPSLHGLRGYAMITSLAACHFHKLSDIKPGCPWLVRLQIVTVDAVNGNHGRLTRRFRVAFEGVQQVLLELFDLLESFLFQATERSSTCSSTPCGCDTTAGVPSRADALGCLSRHGRKCAARSASPSVRITGLVFGIDLGFGVVGPTATAMAGFELQLRTTEESFSV